MFNLREKRMKFAIGIEKCNGIAVLNFNSAIHL
jgi:hypothetical protein